jgi:tetratricopeptide (TPR) repeat protein
MTFWATAALLTASALGPGPAPLPSENQILAVPPELETQFRRQVIDKTESKPERLRLLVDFVLNEPGLGLVYDNETTRTVSETYRTRQANCLSFTLLFVALAREAGLKTHIQEYEEVLFWYLQDGLVYNSSHVNAKVEAGPLRQTVDVGRNMLISRYKPKLITDQRALSFFYNNRGVELMAQGDLVGARRHMEQSLKLAPDEPSGWSNLGVLEMRVGDTASAERAYNEALKLDPRHDATLTNIVALYQRLDNRTLAAKYLKRLNQVQSADPFHQFMMATDSERRGDYAAAVGYYRRAIRLYRDEPAFQLGLARAYQGLGDTSRAERALAKADVLKQENERRALQAKNEERRRRAGAVARQVNF